MSAFLVNRRHIDALVSVALYGPHGARLSEWGRVSWFSEPVDVWTMDWGEIGRLERTATRETANTVGQMLYDANAKSITARYGPEATEVYADHVVHYRFSPVPVRPTAVEAFKLCHCLNYQSCEYKEWPTSEARRFLDALQDDLSRALPGYDAAPWEWPAD